MFTTILRKKKEPFAKEQATMDAFNLKKENRKKFSEKQKLKNKHSTQSDRKYKLLNRQKKASEEAAKEEETNTEEKPAQLPPNNAYRYHEDIDLAFEDLLIDENENKKINEKLKYIIKERIDEEEAGGLPGKEDTGKLTKKELEKMDIDSLNKLLGRKVDEPRGKPMEELPRGDSNTNNPPVQDRNNDETAIPSELADAQDFLDTLL